MSRCANATSDVLILIAMYVIAVWKITALDSHRHPSIEKQLGCLDERTHRDA
jgi:hypothetical protein